MEGHARAVSDCSVATISTSQPAPWRFVKTTVEVWGRRILSTPKSRASRRIG